MPTVEVHALGSGSSGNATLVGLEGRYLLIDAGIGARRLMAWLRKCGVQDGSLEAILITHEHEDHIRAAPSLCKRLAAPVVANRATLQAMAMRAEPPRTVELETGCEFAIGPFRVRSFPVLHDAADPVGYVVEAGGTQIAYATDLGCATPEVAGALKGAHLCVIEANHDLEWLLRGPYPPHMKARVASDAGHLCNMAAAELIAQRLDEGGPATVWLAHLSAVNNSPALARRTVEAALVKRVRVPARVDVALRDQPSLVWRPGDTVIQRSLF